MALSPALTNILMACSTVLLQANQTAISSLAGSIVISDSPWITLGIIRPPNCATVAICEKDLGATAIAVARARGPTQIVVTVSSKESFEFIRAKQFDFDLHAVLLDQNSKCTVPGKKTFVRITF